MRVGYARVSTEDQSTDLQTENLEKLGCEKIYHENMSGKYSDNREELQALINFVREGDTVVVMKLDRLARNTIDALKIADQLKTKHVALEIRDLGGVDVNSETGRMIYTTLSAVAEMERSRINRRCEEGRVKALESGVKFGRKPSIDPSEVFKLQSEGDGATKISKKLGIGRSSVYRILSASKT